jgi:hypothetical protein
LGLATAAEIGADIRLGVAVGLAADDDRVDGAGVEHGAERFDVHADEPGGVCGRQQKPVGESLRQPRFCEGSEIA